MWLLLLPFLFLHLKYQGALRMVGRGSSNGIIGGGSIVNTGVPGIAGTTDMGYAGVVRMRGMPYRCENLSPSFNLQLLFNVFCT